MSSRAPTSRLSEKRPKREGYIPTHRRTSSTVSSNVSSSGAASSLHHGAAHKVSPTPSSQTTPRTRTPLKTKRGDAVELQQHATIAMRHERMMEAEAFGGHSSSVPHGQHHAGLVQSPRPGSAHVTQRGTPPKQPGRSSPSRAHHVNNSPQRPEDPVKKLRHDLEEADRYAQQQIAESVACNQQLLDSMTERRRRAEMLTQLYREDAHETSIEFGRVEEEWKEMQEKRKHLIDLSRTLELQLYQKRKNQSAATIHSTSDATKPPPPGHRGSNSRAALTPSAAAAPMESSSATTTRLHYEELNRRLDAARFVSQELHREIEKAAKQEQVKADERCTLSAYVMQLRKEVTDLEQHEVFVSGVVRESKNVIQNAGSMASRMPHMERLLEELSNAETHIRKDFEKTQKHLMGIIHADDVSIEELRGVVQSRHGASGALPSLLRQLQTENENLQRFAHAFLEDAEKERVELQATADKLQQRLLSMEEKTRALTMRQR